MHSFAPSLSLLLSLFFLPLQLHVSLFGGLAHATEISALNHTAVRDLNVMGHNSHRRRHAEVGEALNGRPGLMLYPGRRAAGARFTNFVTGLGACGEFNQPGDFIVALNMQQFDAGNHCNAAITITANGKTAHARIVDRCVGCGFNNLDLTDGLYAFFDPTMEGVINGDWEYGNGAPAPVTTKMKPIPITTSHRVTSSAASVTPSTSLIASSTTTSAIPTQTTIDGNLENLYVALLGMGGLIMDTLPSST